MLLHGLNQHLPQSMAPQQMADGQNHTLVRHLLQADTGKRRTLSIS